MKKLIPGTVPVEGREFFYIECHPNEGFDEIMDAALSARPDIALPSDGGVIEGKARIKLEGVCALLAVSYRGDLDGWRRKLAAYCEEEDRLWGVVTGRFLVLSNGSKLPLAECEVNFEP